MTERNSISWGPTARKVEPHQFQPDTEGNPRWCRECGWVEDAYVHASEEDRRAFDAARNEQQLGVNIKER